MRLKNCRSRLGCLWRRYCTQNFKIVTLNLTTRLESVDLWNFTKERLKALLKVNESLNKLSISRKIALQLYLIIFINKELYIVSCTAWIRQFSWKNWMKTSKSFFFKIPLKFTLHKLSKQFSKSSNKRFFQNLETLRSPFFLLFVKQIMGFTFATIKTLKTWFFSKWH